MKSAHLTDETLQAVLLNEMRDDTIAAHLAVCTACGEKLANYQQLITGISKSAPETFSFDVTTVVMSKITGYEKKKSKKQAFAFWALLTFLCAGIASLSIPFIPELLAGFNTQSVFTTLLVTGTGLAVLLFLLADMKRQYKTKAEKLFKNALQPIH